MTARRIIFAGPARSVAPFLAGLTANIENFARGFDSWALLVAENDSADNSKVLLKAWMERARAAGAARAALIDMDGLSASQPLRTGRIAAARNRILSEIEQDAELAEFDFLVMLDMDFPNSCPVAPEQFMAAVEFLNAHDDVAGVFPTQLPFYYDIWTLREKDWCPGDCWEEVRQAGGGEAAIAAHVHARQIYVDPARAPIEVESAFGGIGIYRLNRVLGHHYEGFGPGGEEVSDHVGLHRQIRRDGGRFFILPGFFNLSSFEHTNIFQTHVMVPVGAASLLLTQAAAARRAQFPRFGEAFAGLAALYSRGALLDLTPEGGANLVQARRKGFDGPCLLAEAEEREFAILSGNALMQGRLFARHRLVRADPLSALAAVAKDAGVIRFGTANDATLLREALPQLGHQPVLWARMEIPDEAAEWEKTLAVLPYDSILAFNSLGAKIIAGQGQGEKLIALMRRLPRSGGGLDLAFFPSRDREVFAALARP